MPNQLSNEQLISSAKNYAKELDSKEVTVLAAMLVAEAIRVSVGQLTQVISQKGPIER